MARIGDFIRPELATVDYTPFLNASARASQSIGNSISAGIGAFTDVVEQRKKDKEALKAGKEMGKALSTLDPSLKASLEPFLAGLDDENVPLNERAAVASTTPALVEAWIKKQAADRDYLIADRQVSIAEKAPALRAFMEDRETSSKNDADMSEAVSKFIALSEAELQAGNKIPQMKSTTDNIGKLIASGEGSKALKAVNAYSEIRTPQLEPFLKPQTMSPTKIGATGPNGEALTIDAFVTPQGDMFDINRQPINQTDGMVLPPRNDLGAPPPDRRVVPMPTIGIRPSGTTTQRTPEQIQKEQLEIRKLEQELGKQDATAAEASASKAGAIAKAQSALQSLKDIRQHPGRWWATGGTSYIPAVRGTNSYEFEAKLEQAKALAGTIGIEAMRGLGAMSEKEFQAAKDSIAKLDKGLKTETVEKELDKLINLFESRIQAMGGEVPSKTPVGQAKSALDQYPR